MKIPLTVLRVVGLGLVNGACLAAGSLVVRELAKRSGLVSPDEIKSPEPTPAPVSAL